ncbi:MAG: nickel insertion protein, partial [Pseudomonadota bacterium]
KTVDTVHFHEVSDWDSMVDILAAAGVIARLQCPQWRIGPLPLGGGTINTAHGDIPLPAPATVHLLKTFEWIDDGQPGERVTPTGAAILAYLQPDQSNAPASAATMHAIGVGCGTRTLADRANIFRVCAFSQRNRGTASNDVVARLSFEVDDMTGEELAQSTDILRQQTGVLDVSMIAMQGKKGRPVTGLRLLVLPDHSAAVTTQCFQQTTTLGVRNTQVHRQVLQRHETQIDGHRLKTAHRPEDTLSVKIESDELGSADTLQQRRALASQLEQKTLDHG